MEYCVCGHDKEIHEYLRVNGIPVHSFGCECIEFKLDNLRFIEDLAKEKGLI
jgi:rRNA-processing protein FCF1